MILHIYNYIVLTLISILSTKKSYKFFLILFYIYLTLADGTRFESYYDWFSYKNHFYDGASSEIMESGYNLLVKFIKIIGNYNFLLTIISFLLYFLGFFNVYNISKNRISILIMFSIIIPYIGVNRQVISIIILSFSLKYIIEKQFFKFILIILIAMLFHISSFLIVPMYFYDKIKIKYKASYFLKILFFCLFIPIFKKVFIIFLMLLIKNVDFFEKFSVYFQESSEYKLSIFAIVFRNIEIYLPIILGFGYLKNKENKILNMGLVGMLYSYLIYILAYGEFQILLRGIVTLKFLFMPIFYSETLQNINNKSLKKIIISIIFLIISFSMFKALFGEQKNQYIYKNIFIINNDVRISL